MVPRIEFAYLVCSYLPGLPLSFLIYWYVPDILKDYVSVHILISKYTEFTFLYFITSPLIIGLFIDETRHFFEWLIEDAWFFLPPLSKYNPILNRSQIDNELYKLLLSRLIIIYSLYEFFFNIAISIFIIFIVSYYNQWFSMMIITVIFTSLSFMLSQLTRIRQNKLINDYLT